MEIVSASVLLSLVLDPIGNIPAFLYVWENVPAKRRRRIVARELVIALGILILSLFAGRYLLLVLQVSRDSLGTAGAIIFFLIALRMILPDSKRPLRRGTG